MPEPILKKLDTNNARLAENNRLLSQCVEIMTKLYQAVSKANGLMKQLKSEVEGLSRETLALRQRLRYVR